MYVNHHHHHQVMLTAQFSDLLSPHILITRPGKSLSLYPISE